MRKNEYLMESDEEAIRLDIKTNINVVKQQALWAGIKPGMRVADISCGPGKTTAILHKLVQPKGKAIGIDFSEKRIEYAQKHYSKNGVEFKVKNILGSFDELGKFDFIWVRFILEYFRTNNFKIVKQLSKILKPSGVLCLIDLDYNCLTHFGISQKLENTLFSFMKELEEKANFDPYVGRKLYSYLYKLGYNNIDVQLSAHHLIFGKLKNTDALNWLKKIETAPKKINYKFKEYKGGYEEFVSEFRKFFSNPGRFTYTPIICCRGQKPRD